MVGKKPLTEDEKNRIRELNEENHSLQEIAESVGREKRSIANYLAAPDDYGTRRYGTTSTVSHEEKTKIFNLAVNDKMTPNEIKRSLNLNIEKSQINNILRQMGAIFKKPIPKKNKIMRTYDLTPIHHQERLDYCRQYMSFGQKWSKVVYTDEKLWYLNGPPGLQGSWCDSNKPIQQQENTPPKNDQCIMVWGAIVGNNKLSLQFIDIHMTATEYINVLETALPEMIEYTEGEFYLLQDNATVHKSQTVMNWIEEHDIELIDFPRLSPDLNVIENVWAQITNRMYRNGRSFTTLEQLKTAIEEEWRNLTVDDIQRKTDQQEIENRIFNIIRGHGKLLNRKVMNLIFFK